MSADDWRGRANCRDVDPDVMQPEVASGDDVLAALQVCAGCPVRDECRDLALSQPGAFGVHAGRWYGDPPRSPAAASCGWCGGPVAGERSTAAYCGGRCRVAAHRARRSVA